MEPKTYPDKYWHCSVLPQGEKKERAVVNDLSFSELEKTVIEPWLAGRPFTISGLIIRSTEQVSEIKITHTPSPLQYYADVHDRETTSRGISDFATDRRFLPLEKGQNYTDEFLFSGKQQNTGAPDATVSLVKMACKRLSKAAQILCNRSRRGKTPYIIEDEYDVQDLLHGILRTYIKYSVQEDPLPKVAGAKSGRADISIQELGLLIEVKYVHGPQDQKRLFEEFSQDLVLYAQWPYLKTLFYLIYNSSDLKDAEAIEKLGGKHKVSNKEFNVEILLV